MKHSFCLKKNHYRFFVAWLFVALLFMAPDGLFAQKWVAHSGAGAPSGALNIRTNGAQYVSRIPLPNGDFAVGKRGGSATKATYVADGAVVNTTNYEILVATSSEILWEKVTNGVLPDNAFSAGRRDGNLVYPCTCMNPNINKRMVGETRQGLGYCESFGQGGLHQISTYKVATTTTMPDIVIATGFVVSVNTGGTMTVKNGDHIEADTYAPTETEFPKLPAGSKYNIFQITSADNEVQAMLYFGNDDPKWQDFLQNNFQSSKVKGIGTQGDNTLREGDTYKVTYGKGGGVEGLTWDVFRGNKSVGTFSCQIGNGG